MQLKAQCKARHNAKPGHYQTYQCLRTDTRLLLHECDALMQQVLHRRWQVQRAYACLRCTFNQAAWQLCLQLSGVSTAWSRSGFLRGCWLLGFVSSICVHFLHFEGQFVRLQSLNRQAAGIAEHNAPLYNPAERQDAPL